MVLKIGNSKMVEQVFFNCKKDVKKTINKLIIIECETRGLSEDQARKKVTLVLKEFLMLSKVKNNRNG